MNMVDFDNRYAFIGSLTTPPCTRDVYFNVLSTIYPVRQEDLDAYNDRLRPSGTNSNIVSGTNTVPGTGNFRKPQPINGQDLIVIKDPMHQTLAEKDDKIDSLEADVSYLETEVCNLKQQLGMECEEG